MTVRRKLTALTGQEREAQKLRNLESTEHRKAWQERSIIPISLLPTTRSHSVSFVGDGRRNEAESKVVPAKDQRTDAVVPTSSLFRQPHSERQAVSQTLPPSSNGHLSYPAFKAEEAKPYKRPVAINLQRDNERKTQEEKTSVSGEDISFDQPGQQRGVFTASPERTTVFGSPEPSLNRSADPQLSVDRTVSQGPSVPLSPINNHQSDPNEQELLSFLHNAPVPPSLGVHSGPVGRAEESLQGAFEDSPVRKSLVSESVVEEHLQGPLERDHSINTISERFDPQSLFGESGLSHVSEGRQEPSMQGDHLTDPEQQALLNELLSVPLPKADNERSRVLESSRNRALHVNRAFTLE